jgi:cytochrome c-type biogenesis protein CcmH
MFWISAALVSVAAAALILHRAARGARVAAGEDPALSVYRRQLTEIDEMAERGLIADEERRSAHAEAARRLLGAAEATPAKAMTNQGGRLGVAITAALAPLLAILVYAFVGSPGAPDEPFAKRLAEWRHTDPASLDSHQLVAVLQLIVRENPNDPRRLALLAHAEMDAGDSFSAIRDLQRAIDAAPGNPELWSDLGQVYLAKGGDSISPQAVAAFQHALSLDPKALPPRYVLARAKIAGGDWAGGLAVWRALLAELPGSDPRRLSLDREIAIVEQTHALPQAAQPAPAQATPDFVRAMVASLAARLQANPNDPAGWARLIRSYAVLGDSQAQAAALAHARALFKDRPDALRQVETASTGPQ